MKKNSDFEHWVSCLDLWECKILEKVLLELEGYEYMPTVQKRIDERISEMLGGLGFTDG